MNEGTHYKILLGLVSFVAALMFLYSSGTGDVDEFWLQWMDNVAEKGPVQGYAANDAEYPPLSSVILFGAAGLSSVLAVDSFVAFKISLICFLLVTVSAFWWWTRSFLFTLILYWSLFLSSISLGYIDIYFAPFLFGALWALQEKKWALFAILYTMSFSIKWQTLIFAPVLLVYLIEVRKFSQWPQIPWRRLGFQVVLPAIAIMLTMLAIFGMAMIKSFTLALSHEVLSGHALNFPWIMTFFLHLINPVEYGGFPDGHIAILDITDWKILFLPSFLFIVSYGVLLINFFRRQRTFEDFLLFAIVGVMSYFMFSRGVHENHSYIPLLLSVILFWCNRNYLYIMLLFILMTNLNLFIFYGISGEELWFTRVVGIDLSLPLAICNLVFYVFLFLATLGSFPQTLPQRPN